MWGWEQVAQVEVKDPKLWILHFPYCNVVSFKLYTPQFVMQTVILTLMTSLWHHQVFFFIENSLQSHRWHHLKETSHTERSSCDEHAWCVKSGDCPFKFFFFFQILLVKEYFYMVVLIFLFKWMMWMLPRPLPVVFQTHRTYLLFQRNSCTCGKTVRWHALTLKKWRSQRLCGHDGQIKKKRKSWPAVLPVH